MRECSIIDYKRLLQFVKVDGDYRFFARYIRDGWPLEDQALRECLADIVEGKRRPPRRPKSAEASFKTKLIAAYAFDQKRRGEKHHINKTQDALNVTDPRTVSRAIERCEPWMCKAIADVILTVAGHQQVQPVDKGDCWTIVSSERDWSKSDT